MSHLIALTFWILIIWIIRRDTARRPGISAALWIPTLWAAILLSRPFSTWVGFGGGSGGVDSQEGSPADRIFFLGLIAASVITLLRRRVNWGAIFAQNWHIVAFYGFFLVSVLWAESPFVSLKRWFKDAGNIFVALVILTERNPSEAIRAVFVRCGYVLLPLSVIFIRYFPDLGRTYNIHSGGMEAIGVTFQKNSLGALVMVCGVVLVWDWLERSRPEYARQKRLERFLPIVMLLIGAYLLRICDSKTSILCLAISAAIVASIRLPGMRQRVGKLGIYSLVAAGVFILLDQSLGITEAIVRSMGRDMTFTGRTEVWNVLFGLNTDPLIGTGFCSFWSDHYYLRQLPNWVAFSAHNGYIEVYIDGGIIGVVFLSLMLVVHAVRLNGRLGMAGDYAVVQFAVFVMTLVGNFSESHFVRMSPLWFIFLVTALVSASTLQPARAAAVRFPSQTVPRRLRVVS